MERKPPCQWRKSAQPPRLCRSRSLASVLDEFKYFPGLGVHWVMFGPSGRESRPEGGGVLRHYTSCYQAPDKWVKTIVNTFYVTGAAIHPHGSEFRCALHAGGCVALATVRRC